MNRCRLQNAHRQISLPDARHRGTTHYEFSTLFLPGPSAGSQNAPPPPPPPPPPLLPPPLEPDGLEDMVELAAVDIADMS